MGESYNVLAKPNPNASTFDLAGAEEAGHIKKIGKANGHPVYRIVTPEGESMRSTIAAAGGYATGKGSGPAAPSAPRQSYRPDAPSAWSPPDTLGRMANTMKPHDAPYPVEGNVALHAPDPRMKIIGNRLAGYPSDVAMPDEQDQMQTQYSMRRPDDQPQPQAPRGGVAGGWPEFPGTATSSMYYGQASPFARDIPSEGFNLLAAHQHPQDTRAGDILQDQDRDEIADARDPGADYDSSPLPPPEEPDGDTDMSGEPDPDMDASAPEGTRSRLRDMYLSTLARVAQHQQAGPGNPPAPTVDPADARDARIMDWAERRGSYSFAPGGLGMHDIYDPGSNAMGQQFNVGMDTRSPQQIRMRQSGRMSMPFVDPGMQARYGPGAERARMAGPAGLALEKAAGLDRFKREGEGMNTMLSGLEKAARMPGDPRAPMPFDRRLAQAKALADARRGPAAPVDEVKALENRIATGQASPEDLARHEYLKRHGGNENAEDRKLRVNAEIVKLKRALDDGVDLARNPITDEERQFLEAYLQQVRRDSKTESAYEDPDRNDPEAGGAEEKMIEAGRRRGLEDRLDVLQPGASQARREHAEDRSARAEDRARTLADDERRAEDRAVKDSENAVEKTAKSMSGAEAVKNVVARMVAAAQAANGTAEDERKAVNDALDKSGQDMADIVNDYSEAARGEGVNLGPDNPENPSDPNSVRNYLIYKYRLAMGDTQRTKRPQDFGQGEEGSTPEKTEKHSLAVEEGRESSGFPLLRKLLDLPANYDYWKKRGLSRGLDVMFDNAEGR